MGDRPAPDLFTALSLEPARATPPIDRDAAAPARGGFDPTAGEPDEIEEVSTAPMPSKTVKSCVVIWIARCTTPTRSG